MNEIRNKLEKYDLFYGSFQYLSQTDYHRDFLLYIETDSLTKLRIRLIGVVSMNYNSRVIRDSFNISDDLLIEDLMPPYNGFHWGIRAFEISNWKIQDDGEDIERIQPSYNCKLHKITFEVSSANISFIFHDLDIEEVN
jgi:hypothetical protein